MTDDIVARLRRPAPDFGLEQYDPTYDDRQEAADKIDRLREALLKISELEPEGPLGNDCMAVSYASETARAALAGGEER